MTGTTISIGVTSGVTLSNAALYNPVTILAGVGITNAAGAGILGTGTSDWTIGNAGTVQSTGTSAGNNGIALQGGGTIANGSAGVVSGYYFGVTMAGAGTVVNAGSIGAGVTAFTLPGTTTRFSGYIVGSDHALTPLAGGIVMAGGQVSNAASGTISNYFFGVALSAAGTVTNQGRVTAASTNIGFGIILTSGGGITNTGTGSILAGVDGVLGGYGGPTNVTNQGTIIGSIRDGLDLRSTLAAQAISNAAGGTIAGYKIGADVIGSATIVNAGSIVATGTAGYGFAYNSAHTQRYLTDGGVFMGSGVLNNGMSGTISDKFYGIVNFGGGTVTNQGDITSTQLKAVYIIGAGEVTNSGTGVISGHRAGVLLRSGGGVYNYVGTINSYYIGVSISGNGTVVNTGSIIGTGTYGTGTYYDSATSHTYLTNGGIVMDGGTVLNLKSADISDKFLGIALLGAGTVTNLGSVASTERYAGAGVYLKAGGTILNEAGATITAEWIGAQIGYRPATGSTVASPGGTLLNQGFIFASDGTNGAAAWMHGPGLISNASTGTIEGGPYGVVVYESATTVLNVGTISGTANGIDALGGGTFGNQGTIIGGAYALYTMNGSTDRVIVAPGAVFSGTVSGGKAGSAAASSVLELAAGAAGGTITGFGAKYTGFAQVTLDSAATWTLGGTVAASQTLAFAGTGDRLTLTNPTSIAGDITGFSAGDTIVLAGVAAVTSAKLGANNVLTVGGTAGAYLTLQFDPGQTFSGTNFGFSTVPFVGTAIIVPCFAAGTRIRTANGARAVESLHIGDIVSTQDGPADITWIGHRHVDCAHHPRPQDVRPIRIEPGAFGENLPSNPLRLSPDHAVFIDGMLVPIRCLINGQTIVQEPVSAVTYYHIALPTHGILFAEDLACESYLDTGNRNAFENGGAALTLHPSFNRDIHEARGYADLITAGPRLDALRRRLEQVAGSEARPGGAAPWTPARGHKAP